MAENALMTDRPPAKSHSRLGRETAGLVLDYPETLINGTEGASNPRIIITGPVSARPCALYGAPAQL